jgi:hypothetical protein
MRVLSLKVSENACDSTHRQGRAHPEDFSALVHELNEEGCHNVLDVQGESFGKGHCLLGAQHESGRNVATFSAARV